jgi:predicted PilT family ATPase
VDEGEPQAETQTAALVVVPDNQLSLAIGKKGQNARLAAKLTGMRIDIKSESEVEAERAEAEHAEAARAALSTLPGVTPEAFQALIETGLVSPRAVAAAGRDRLAALPAIGAAADTIVAAAEAWVAEREPKHPQEDDAAVAEPEHPPATA